MKIHKPVAFALLLLVVPFCYGQEYMNLDSLLEVERHSPDDTSKVRLLVMIGQQYEGNTPDSAIYYYEKVLHLSRDLGYTRGEISYYTNVTYVYNMQGRYDTALLLNRQALDIAYSFGDRERIASCLVNVGTSFVQLERYDSAGYYYLKSTKMLEELGLEQRSMMIYSNLIVLYINLGDFDKALIYADKAIDMARKNGDTYQLLLAIVNSSKILVEVGDFDKTTALLKEGLKIAEKNNDQFVINTLLSNLGDVYLKTKHYDDAFEIFSKGIPIAEKIGDLIGISSKKRGLAYCYLYKSDYENALRLVNESLDIALRTNNAQEATLDYLLISDIYLANGQKDLYDIFRYKHDSLGQRLDRENMQKTQQRLEEQYRTAEKEQKIETLEKAQIARKLEYRTNVFVFLSLAGLLLSGLIVTYLVLRNVKQKRLLLQRQSEAQQARIGELEKEKQLLASEAVMKGQEEERHRLAKDLHDGLGGMLSGIKYSFNTMKENLIMTPENQRAFERSMDMLDSSIHEMRRVAHNLMPESLIKFGLGAAINDICKDITSGGALRVTFQSFDLDKMQVDQSVLIIIYRIVQELLNNTMKHAGAAAALVQLIYREQKLTITVEDDGNGFDTTMVDMTGGIGLSNIKSRVDYLNGILDIQSSPGRGSTFNIELTL